jgi:cation:H+ antiporter
MSATDAADTAGDAPAAPTTDDDARRRALRKAVAQFVIAAIVLLVAAPMFARSAEAVAVATGLGTTFVGTWLVGFSTSLPELVTSLAAIRLKAYDLAVGNLFGSNAFNMSVFPLLDAAHAGPPVLSVANPAHAISALVAIALMAIALAALVYRARGRLKLLEPSALLIILGYLAGLGLVFAGSR